MIDMADEFDAILKRVKKETEEKGSKKWRTEGRNEGIEEVARNMIADGSIPIQKIAKLSKLPIEEIESIRNSMHI